MKKNVVIVGYGGMGHWHAEYLEKITRETEATINEMQTDR